MTELSDLLTKAKLYARDDGAWAEDPQDIAETACRLAAIVSAAQKGLDALKPVLRTAARKARKGTHVNWETPAGKVSVTFPHPKYVPRKGLHWDKARADLGVDFETYFTAHISYSVRKDIEDRIKNRLSYIKTAGDGVESSEIPKLMEILERDEPTPRVGFKPTSN